MTINRTTLLDLPLPVTGTESGVWGDVVNNGLSQYIDISVAGSLSLSADSDTNLSSTEGDASATNIGSTTAQYAILRCTGARTATRNINAPAWAISGGTLTNYSKVYIVVNETTGSQNIVLRATNSATPTYTTGVTIVPGERAVCAWNGSDFVKVGGAAGGSTTQIQFNNAGVFGGSANLTWDGTNVQIGATGALRLADTDSSNYVAFKSPGTVASNVTWTLPSADGSANQAIVTNGSGTLSFATISTAAATPTTLGTVYGKSDNGSPYETALGYQALAVTSGGAANVAVGYRAGYAITSGQGNIAIGAESVYAVTTGSNNIGIGRNALQNNTASGNVGIGYNALTANTTGTTNTAVGFQALDVNTTGIANTAFGSNALGANTTANSNTAIGTSALLYNTTGANNTSLGTEALVNNTTASNNTAMGYQALYANTTANNSTAVGYQALAGSNTNGSNTAVGAVALTTNTTGTQNVAVGGAAMQLNTTGSYNSALGLFALYSNTTGAENTAVGNSALYSNTSGNYNHCLGVSVMRFNTTGSNNVAMGHDALRNNTTASYNTAVGYQAGYTSNATAAPSNIGANVFIGSGAGYSTTSAIYSVIIGAGAGYSVNTGSSNTLVGRLAGYNLTSGTFNTFVGPGDNNGGSGSLVSTGGKNTIIGAYSGNQGGLDIRTASNYIVLSDGDGNPRSFSNGSGLWSFGETGTILGRVHSNYCPALNDNSSAAANQRGTFVAYMPSSGTNDNGAFNGLLFISGNAGGTSPPQYIRAYNATNAATPVFQVLHSGNVQNANNSYGAVSDIRIKENIVDATPKLDSLLKVRVVNFNLKDDAEKQKQIGVIAQEVEQVFPGLVETDGEGTKSVKYSVFVPMLVKAVQELSAQVQTLQAEIATLKGA